MGTLTKIPTSIPEVFLIEPRVFSDARGFFFESYSRRDMERIGVPYEFVQDNHSSSAKGVLRGLHYQSQHPQGKLIRVLRGSIYDVVIDIRKNSPTFGTPVGVEISAKHHRMIWIPKGFAHGFLALEDHTEVHYKTTDFYYPEYDAGIRWDDPDLGISWPRERYGISSVNISDKDARLPLFKEIDSPFEYGCILP
ncbi:dTDP-4-dehydrorhamnose 3,5-epimerase [Methanoregula sp.]|uniref:dTDP-4-dehydrorhamnose 3,5-epimerase n=1 Tax=Methanoregula sp. TaxID=2052170 RepID=UPI003BB18302